MSPVLVAKPRWQMMAGRCCKGWVQRVVEAHFWAGTHVLLGYPPGVCRTVSGLPQDFLNQKRREMKVSVIGHPRLQAAVFSMHHRCGRQSCFMSVKKVRCLQRATERAHAAVICNVSRHVFTQKKEYTELVCKSVSNPDSKQQCSQCTTVVEGRKFLRF